MPALQKPMLASAFDPSKAKYPYLATPKIDGIRVLMVGGAALSRTFKPIRNAHVQSLLTTWVPDGVDGELTCGDNFQSSTSSIMSSSGKPDFTLWAFDYVDPAKPDIAPYSQRVADLARLLEPKLAAVPFKLQLLTHPQSLPDLKAVQAAAADYTAQGFEGLILRQPDGGYKFGRSTVRENLVLKVKDFEDDEAVVIGFLEKMHNTNPAKQDAFQHTKRSSCKEGKVGADTLGAVRVRRPTDGIEFKVGSGFNDEQRAHIWANQAKYMGALLKFKYMVAGVKDKPRHPIFLGWRHQDDL